MYCTFSYEPSEYVFLYVVTPFFVSNFSLFTTVGFSLGAFFTLTSLVFEVLPESSVNVSFSPIFLYTLTGFPVTGS